MYVGRSLGHRLFMNFSKFLKNSIFWKIKKDFVIHFFEFFKISKKVYDRPIAEFKCNYWRRDSITNITSNVVVFYQHSVHLSSTFLKFSKVLQNSKIVKIKDFLKKSNFLKILNFGKFKTISSYTFWMFQHFWILQNF